MKKILMLCLVLVMMMAFTVPAFAVISPGAGVVTDPNTGGGPTDSGATQPGSNDSPTAPQTGSTVLFLTVAGVAVASISAAIVATKKLASEN